MFWCWKQLYKISLPHKSSLITVSCLKWIIKGVPKKTRFFQKYFGFLKMFFLLNKSFGCQRKSFRYRTKENFDTCLRSEGLIITELCHFLWDQFMLTQHKVRLRIVNKWMFKMLVSTKNVISQWICVLQTWDRCQNFPWFDT